MSEEHAGKAGISTPFWEVRTVAGYAGGTSRRCEATLKVLGYADTVEEVRELVEVALKGRATLEAMADAAAGLYSMLVTSGNSEAVIVANLERYQEAFEALAKLREEARRS